jgi:hypothetical protein
VSLQVSEQLQYGWPLEGEVRHDPQVAPLNADAPRAFGELREDKAFSPSSKIDELGGGKQLLGDALEKVSTHALIHGNRASLAAHRAREVTEAREFDEEDSG